MVPVDDIEALLLDLGNVVIGIDFERCLRHWAGSAGRPVDDLRQRFAMDEAYERHERGQIDRREYYAHLRQVLEVGLSDDDLQAGWNDLYTGVVSEVVPLLSRLDRPLYAFTNTNATHHAAWSARYPEALQPFRRIFLSHAMGLRKPEAAAFRHVADEIGASTERILFLDDTAENVCGARAVGMPAVHVRGPGDTVAALTPFVAG
jgi:HAD superfamily hydrolase (TIGR01509 family)